MIKELVKKEISKLREKAKQKRREADNLEKKARELEEETINKE